MKTTLTKIESTIAPFGKKCHVVVPKGWIGKEVTIKIKGKFLVQYSLTVEQLRKTIKKCIENVNGLLDSTYQLHADKKTVQYALGLYMYAVEEYGKAHLLKSYLSKDKSSYTVPGWVFGKGNPPSGRSSHNEKLHEGFNNLPPRCRKLSNLIWIRSNTSPSMQIHSVKTPSGTVSIPVGAFATGIFEDTTSLARELELDLKTGCFYIDWDEDSKAPLFIFPAEKDQLSYNIELMRRAVSDFQW